MRCCDLLAWLETQPLYPKVFWKEKGDPTCYAAVGASQVFSHIPSNTQARVYGGIRFSRPPTEKASVWQEFPKSYFWQPEQEISCQEDLSNLGSYSVQGTQHSHLPDEEQWSLLIETTLQAIRAHEIEKLVLARQTTVQLKTPLSPWTVIADLLLQRGPSTLFAFQMSPSTCFLGATPELLFKREGLSLHTEAIAGTRRRGIIEQELLQSDKDRREFNYVKHTLEDTLRPLASAGGWQGEDRVLKTPQVQHLYNRLELELKELCTDRDLIERLHPTAALGGHPKETALALIQQLEPFDRGWYGAPVGVIAPHSSTFYVAIRSALLKESQIHLFAGLGVVAGSCPKQEWDELNAKISWLKSHSQLS